MGGCFSSPEPPAYTPPAATTDPDAEARKARLDNMARNRRGRASMIATSDRGSLDPINAAAGTPTGKRLLGE